MKLPLSPTGFVKTQTSEEMIRCMVVEYWPNEIAQ
ncbi:MAG: hypothetical protein JWN76_2229 [Chitinophagaceae bacterium]|nr:hypothetical protein [Chitinophagaceae bacterium]